MRIGVPREVKDHERRVALPPAAVNELTVRGHDVIVEAGAGSGSSFTDAEYAAAGAKIAADAAAVWSSSELVVKVKEPTAAEYGHLRADLTVFTYLHLAASKELTQALVDSGCTAIAYETITGRDGSLPLLAPMSKIAGRMAAQVAASQLIAPDGRGILMGGIAGVRPARVTVIGAGTAGTQAAAVASAMGAHVYLLDLQPDVLDAAEVRLAGRVETLVSNDQVIGEAVADSDVVIGAVLVPGRRAPVVLRSAHWRSMPDGAVFVDISIDQGGCAETSRPTTHSDPTYDVDGVRHYCVTNIPGAAPRTSTLALSNSTLPKVITLASTGVEGFGADDPGLRAGINVMNGQVTSEAVAAAHGLTWSPA